MNIIAALRTKAKSCKNAVPVAIAAAGVVFATSGPAAAVGLLDGITFDSATLMIAGGIVVGATFAVFNLKKIIGLFQGR